MPVTFGSSFSTASENEECSVNVEYALIFGFEALTLPLALKEAVKLAQQRNGK